MPLDTTPIRQITYNVDQGEIVVQWVSTAPVGSWYQLYVNGALLWWGKETFKHVPMGSGRMTFVVGVVDAANVSTDYSDSLPTQPEMRAKLSWLGGRYLAEDIAGFKVYAGRSPGAAVDYSREVATIPAFSGSQYLDGFGRGGFGRGGFGRAAQHYEWESETLMAGVWNFAIQSVDIHGNPCVTPTTGSVVIAGPPEPPARDTDGRRLHYRFQ